MNRVEQWRQEKGYTYDELAVMLGCSRQYAYKICKEGTAAVTKAVKLLSLANGAFSLDDMLSEEARAELVVQGFIKPSQDELDEPMV